MKHKHPLCSLTLLGVHEPSYLSIFSLSLATYLNLCTNPPYLSLVWVLMNPPIFLSFLSLWLSTSPCLWKHAIFLPLSCFSVHEPSPLSIFVSLSLATYLNLCTNPPYLSLVWMLMSPHISLSFLSLWLPESPSLWKHTIFLLLSLFGFFECRWTLLHLSNSFSLTIYVTLAIEGCHLSPSLFLLFWVYMNHPISLFLSFSLSLATYITLPMEGCHLYPYLSIFGL